MNRRRKIILANDNDPLHIYPRGDAAGFKSILRAKDMERRLQALEDHKAFKEDEMQVTAEHSQISQPYYGKSKPKLIIALILLLGATLLGAYAYNSAQSQNILTLALLIMVWSALLISYLAGDDRSGEQDKNQSKKMHVISEISAMIAAFSGLGLWLIASHKLGLPVTAADGVFGFSALALLTAALMRSPLALLISAATGLLWVSLYTDTSALNLISIWMLPVLGLLQCIQAGKFGTKFASFITLIAVYAGLALMFYDYYLRGDISLLHIAAMSLMLGLAHYRMGKALGDMQWKSTSLHVVFGWTLAMAGALALQNYWLGHNDTIWRAFPSTAFGDMSWQIIGALAVAIVGIAGMIRMSYFQMSTMAVFLNLALAVGAAALFDQRAAIDHTITTSMNMPSSPLVGFIIGAAILASATAMAINGVRSKSTTMLIIGLGVIAIQLGVLLDPQIWTAEISVAFGLALITSLCLAALFAAEDSPARAA